MKRAGRRSHTEEITATLGNDAAVARFTAAREVLLRHLVHTREVPNGRDFLFSGPGAELHEALKTLVEIEHQASRFLQFDYVPVNGYFLLRIIGLPEFQAIIARYFRE